MAGQEGDVRGSAGRVAASWSPSPSSRAPSPGCSATGSSTATTRGSRRSSCSWSSARRRSACCAAAWRAGPVRCGGREPGRGERGCAASSSAVLLLAQVHDPVAHGLAWSPASLVALWPATWRFDGGGSGPERLAGVPRRRRDGAARRAGRAHRGTGGAGARSAAHRGDHGDVRDARAVPRAVHGRAGHAAAGHRPRHRSRRGGRRAGAPLLAGRLAVLGAVVVVLGAVIGGTAGPALRARWSSATRSTIGHGDAAVSRRDAPWPSPTWC